MVDAYEAVYRKLVVPARVEPETAAIGDTEVEPLDREVERVSSPRAVARWISM